MIEPNFSTSSGSPQKPTGDSSSSGPKLRCTFELNGKLMTAKFQTLQSNLWTQCDSDFSLASSKQDAPVKLAVTAQAKVIETKTDGQVYFSSNVELQENEAATGKSRLDECAPTSRLSGIVTGDPVALAVSISGAVEEGCYCEAYGNPVRYRKFCFVSNGQGGTELKIIEENLKSCKC